MTMKEKRKNRRPINAIPCECGGVYKVYCTVVKWSYVKCSTCKKTKKVVRAV